VQAPDLGRPGFGLAGRPPAAPDRARSSARRDARPDADARRALWSARADPSRTDTERLVAASEQLTTAEIQHAAQTAAQASFERELLEPGSAGVTEGPTTEDYVVAITGIRPSLTPELRLRFEQDIAAHARI